jgi:hypothetical protein
MEGENSGRRRATTATHLIAITLHRSRPLDRSSPIIKHKSPYGNNKSKGKKKKTNYSELGSYGMGNSREAQQRKQLEEAGKNKRKRKF